MTSLRRRLVSVVSSSAFHGSAWAGGGVPDADPRRCTSARVTLRSRSSLTNSGHDVPEANRGGSDEAEVKGLHEGAGVQPHKEQAAQGKEGHQQAQSC
ncbi:hypothetical protein E2C01_001562 [Portunus trituberculatus]|uniref:Uncharacterized protein n=1 Tax=Portunus trituberculatus TaxID=210409 RepID=A0A5B7CMT6_PORTR|nr:hypothetical protein [Portunus trituberculatus]